MIKPIIFVREDYCINCHTSRAIECYDVFNNPIKFSMILDQNKNIDNCKLRDIHEMKCKRCNTSYIIDWSEKRPQPLVLESYLNNFISKFLTDKH